MKLGASDLVIVWTVWTERNYLYRQTLQPNVSVACLYFDRGASSYIDQRMSEPQSRNSKTSTVKETLPISSANYVRTLFQSQKRENGDIVVFCSKSSVRKRVGRPQASK